MSSRPQPEPNLAEYPDAPRITLADKEWPVPLLVPRQNRVVVPLVLKLSINGVRLDKMSTETYDDLTTIAFWAVRRAHPVLLQEDFLDWNISTVELVSAFLTIAAQTGMLKKKQQGDVEDMGEASEGQKAPQTGTE